MTSRHREPAVTPELELLHHAWGVIANAGWDGQPASPGWQEAAIAWRDQYHALLDAGRYRRRPAQPATGTEIWMETEPAPGRRFRRLRRLAGWRVVQADDPIGLMFRPPPGEQ